MAKIGVEPITTLSYFYSSATDESSRSPTAALLLENDLQGMMLNSSSPSDIEPTMSPIRVTTSIFIFEVWRLISSYLPRTVCFRGLANVNRTARLAVLSVHFIRNSAVVKSFAIRYLWAQHYSLVADDHLKEKDKLPNSIFIDMLKPLQQEYYDLHQFVHPSSSLMEENQQLQVAIPNYYSRNLIKAACIIGNTEIILQLIEKPYLLSGLSVKSSKYLKLALMNNHFETAVTLTRALLMSVQTTDISKYSFLPNFDVLTSPYEFNSEYVIMCQLFALSSENCHQKGIIRTLYDLLHSQLLFETCHHDHSKMVNWTNLLNTALFNTQLAPLAMKFDTDSIQFIIERLHQVRTKRVDNHQQWQQHLFELDLDRMLLQIVLIENVDFLLWFFTFICSSTPTGSSSSEDGGAKLLSNSIFNNLTTIQEINFNFFKVYMNQFTTDRGGRDEENDQTRLYQFIDEMGSSEHVTPMLIPLLRVIKIPFERISKLLNSCAQFYLVHHGPYLVELYEAEMASLIFNNTVKPWS